ncbi:MAG: DUF1080 domain-containing protein [Candidatus Hydrogenedentes bacterium]|nr:DUF1080 domain-containing protein [Candidatus Hydrogenedentota bacterium]
MNLHKTLMIISIIALLLSSCTTVSHVAGKDDFRVIGKQLYRNTSSFTLNAIYEPDLCAKGAALEHMVPAMAKVAEVGGNAIAFDLCGFEENGRKLSEASITTIASYSQRAKNQRMALIVRVLDEEQCSHFRRNAVATAAKALADVTLAIYWIDGPNAEKLAARFKKISPHLVVAAPNKGDIKITTSPEEAKDSGFFFLVNKLPCNPRGNVNYVLTGTPETYKLLDNIYKTDVEKTIWTPDNSILSEAEQSEGFISLFNGRDLNNWWSFHHGEKSFRVNDEGNIECYQSGAGAIMSSKRYGDFILRLEYKLTDKDANSGIHLRAPRVARQSKIGFEFQIMGDSYLTEPHKNSTAAVYDVIPALAVASHPEGEWNEVEIMLNGPHLKAMLNGILVQDVNFDEFEELRYRLRYGFIDLQDHDSYVLYRNVRIKEL